MHRREFLRLGGATVLGAAVLGACTSDSHSTSPPPGQPPTTVSPASSNGVALTDLALTKTAASLEAMLVGAYRDLTASPLVTNDILLMYSTTFMLHHQAHLDALNQVITATNGQAAITAPNDAMQNQVVRPALAAAKTQDDLANLFFTLEDATAQAYVYSTSAMGRAEYRSLMMTIGGIEARHRALLGVQIEQQPLSELFPTPFARTDNPLPPDALVT
jgi:hypothetical protein